MKWGFARPRQAPFWGVFLGAKLFISTVLLLKAVCTDLRLCQYNTAKMLLNGIDSNPNTVQEHFREAGVMRGDGLWA